MTAFMRDDMRRDSIKGESPSAAIPSMHNKGLLPKVLASHNSPLAVYLVPILAQHDVLHAVAEGEILLAANGMAATAGFCHCKTVVPSAHIRPT